MLILWHSNSQSKSVFLTFKQKASIEHYNAHMCWTCQLVFTSDAKLQYDLSKHKHLLNQERIQEKKKIHKINLKRNKNLRFTTYINVIDGICPTFNTESKTTTSLHCDNPSYKSSYINNSTFKFKTASLYELYTIAGSIL